MGAISELLPLSPQGGMQTVSNALGKIQRRLVAIELDRFLCSVQDDPAVVAVL